MFFQVDKLLRELCRLHKIEVPAEVKTLLGGEGSRGQCSSAKSNEESSANTKPVPDQMETEKSCDDIDIDMEFGEEEDEPTELDDSVFVVINTKKFDEKENLLFKTSVFLYVTDRGKGRCATTIAVTVESISKCRKFK